METINSRQLSAQALPRPITPGSGHEEKANGRFQRGNGQHKVEPKFWHRRKQRSRYCSSSPWACKRITRRTGSVPIVSERATRRMRSVRFVVTRLCPSDRVVHRALRHCTRWGRSVHPIAPPLTVGPSAGSGGRLSHSNQGRHAVGNAARTPSGAERDKGEDLGP